MSLEHDCWGPEEEEQDEGPFSWVCFACGFYEETGEDGTTFIEAWGDAKAMGWRAYKEGESWRHKCPDCSKRKPLSIGGRSI